MIQTKEAKAGSLPRKSPSVAAIARECGLSTASVSRALNGHPSVSEDNRARVLAAAEKLGYRPDPVLKRFFAVARSGGTRTVVFLIDPVVHRYVLAGKPFYTRIMLGLQGALKEQGLHMLVSNAATDVLPDGNLYAIAEGIAGGIVAETPDRELIERLARHAPVTTLNAESRVEGVDSAIPDVEHCAEQQIGMLANLGHRRIACFRQRAPSGVPSGWQDRRFWSAYEAQCRQLGFPLPASYLEPISFGPNEHVSAIAAFLARTFRGEDRPTAILTYDAYAGELIRQLADRGLSVPRDVSIMGYDDDADKADCSLPLTTYRQNFEEMAKVAAALLKTRMADPGRATQTAAVQGSIIVRESSGPCPDVSAQNQGSMDASRERVTNR
ncbi:MAG: LacI family DNA-binding transcriptional regulator [Kiritimatiellae bacterium]|nr:LacI family DNA-binding transcriptional regulator [Kiritimatiellia bacterium]